MKRSDGRRSKTVLFNLFALVGALALETFGAELESAPLLRKIFVFVLAAVNLGLRYVTTLPLAGRAPRGPSDGAGLGRGPRVVGLALLLGVALSACGPLRYTCARAPDPGPTYRYNGKTDRTVLVAPCDTDPAAVILSWPGKVKLRTTVELAPTPSSPETRAGDE